MKTVFNQEKRKDKPKFDFPEIKAKELMVEMQAHPLHHPSFELIKIHNNLLMSLINKDSYSRYDKELKEDMLSFAVYEFIMYGYKYNPEKGKLFTFFAFNGENSFKCVLKKHYKHVNNENLMFDTFENVQDRENYVETYNKRLCDESGYTEEELQRLDILQNELSKDN